MKNRELTVPVVNLNGTSADELYGNLVVAHAAIYKAISAVRQTVPNARDYQMTTLGTFDRAMVEHRDRIDALIRVRKEISFLMEAVYRQNPIHGTAVRVRR